MIDFLTGTSIYKTRNGTIVKLSRKVRTPLLIQGKEVSSNTVYHGYKVELTNTRGKLEFKKLPVSYSYTLQFNQDGNNTLPGNPDLDLMEAVVPKVY